MGNYVIIRQLGIGGIGTVYLAQHRLLNQRAVVKVHDFFPDNQYIGIAFMRAANYLSQLDHPNIVHLFDYGFQNGRAYQVMEYVDGSTLASIIPNRQTRTWLNRCLEYFAQLLSAVRYAHNCQYRDLEGNTKRGIIHGDIKPHNVLLDQSADVVKLTDFMIPDVQALLRQKHPDFRRLEYDTAAYGTPEYMAPEQKQGRVTQQTDVFSLGATLYQLVTNCPPIMIRSGVTPKKVNPEVPDWLDAFIIKAMEREPAKRFQTVAEMESILLTNQSRQNHPFIFKLKEFFMGDKIDVRTGDLSQISGQLFIGKFNEVIVNLNTAGQGELAEALKVLKEAIMASQHLSDDKKQEQVEVINQIGEEASKPKPNKTLLKMLGNGLMATLKAIPDVAKAIAEVAPFLTKLYP